MKRSSRSIMLMWSVWIMIASCLLTGCGQESKATQANQAEQSQPAVSAQIAAPQEVPAKEAVPNLRQSSTVQTAGSTETVRTITTTIEEETTRHSGPKVRRVALFIKNRTGAQFDSKIDAFGDLVTGYITDKGFSVISRDDAINAVASFEGDGANAGDSRLPGANLDAMLSNNTSALRLADMLGADYLLSVSITTFGEERKAVNAYGIKREIQIARMRASGKILDRFVGGSLSALNVSSEKKSTVSSHAATLSDDIINTLLDDCANKMAVGFGERATQGRIMEATGNDSLATLTVSCTIQDYVIPGVSRGADGTYRVSQSNYSLGAPDVTVELNGTVIGSAPGTFKVRPGLSKIRLDRQGCEPWEKTINVYDGQELKVALRLTDRVVARWAQQASFLSMLKAGEKLTDAQVKVAEGLAQTLRQSGFKVDIAGSPEGMVNVKNSIW